MKPIYPIHFKIIATTAKAKDFHTGFNAASDVGLTRILSFSEEEQPLDASFGQHNVDRHNTSADSIYFRDTDLADGQVAFGKNPDFKSFAIRYARSGHNHVDTSYLLDKESARNATMTFLEKLVNAGQVIAGWVNNLGNMLDKSSTTYQLPKDLSSNGVEYIKQIDQINATAISKIESLKCDPVKNKPEIASISKRCARDKERVAINFVQRYSEAFDTIARNIEFLILDLLDDLDTVQTKLGKIVTKADEQTLKLDSRHVSDKKLIDSKEESIDLQKISIDILQRENKRLFQENQELRDTIRRLQDQLSSVESNKMTPLAGTSTASNPIGSHTDSIGHNLLDEFKNELSALLKYSDVVGTEAWQLNENVLAAIPKMNTKQLAHFVVETLPVFLAKDAFCEVFGKPEASDMIPSASTPLSMDDRKSVLRQASQHAVFRKLDQLFSLFHARKVAALYKHQQAGLLGTVAKGFSSYWYGDPGLGEPASGGTANG